jgi:amino-acid N-acetyltransferase
LAIKFLISVSILTPTLRLLTVSLPVAISGAFRLYIACLFLRKAENSEIPLIERLLRDNNLPYEDIHSKVNSLFICYANSGIVGIGGVEIFGKHALLRSLVVKEEFRGKGFGKAIYRELEKYASSKGVEELYLLTTTAEAFFEKLGFRRVDRNSAPEVVKNNDEFTSLCPSSAICMMKRIRGGEAVKSGCKLKITGLILAAVGIFLMLDAFFAVILGKRYMLWGLEHAPAAYCALIMRISELPSPVLLGIKLAEGAG